MIITIQKAIVLIGQKVEIFCQFLKYGYCQSFKILISDFAAAFDECRLHEAAKLLEEFIINLLSQTYIPIVRNDLWDDNEESWERRLCVYSVLNHILKNLDIMLHPISPFVTRYPLPDVF